MAAEKTFRAITEVHITEKLGKPADKAKGISATPPTVAVIPAKSKFTIDPDSDVCKQLVRGGAIEAVSDEEAKPSAPRKVSVEKPTKAAAPAKAAAKDAAKDDKDDKGSKTDDDGKNLV